MSLIGMATAGGGLNFGLGRYVRQGAPKWGSKELIVFEKIRSKELKIFNIIGHMNFEPNLGCRAENSLYV